MRRNKTILETIKAIKQEADDCLTDKEISTKVYKAKMEVLHDFIVLLDFEKKIDDIL